MLLPSVHTLHTQGVYVMSYFPVLIHYTHRVDVLCLTSQCSFTTHTGWMYYVLLPSAHILHTQGGCMMSYFPVLIPYTHRVDKSRLTSQCESLYAHRVCASHLTSECLSLYSLYIISQCPIPVHTGWMHSRLSLVVVKNQLTLCKDFNFPFIKILNLDTVLRICTEMSFSHINLPKYIQCTHVRD